MTRRDLIAAAILVALNLLVFGQILGHEFLGFDDSFFVYENQHVKQGFTSASIRWAFTSTERGWYPLTWLSHMLDVELYGLRPAGHFASALLFHVLATLAVFLAVRLVIQSREDGEGSPSTPTAARGDEVILSAIVAALFAIHPMHVESVAWISERRDTVSALFGMLALAAYARRKLVLVAIAFLASLLAKQTLVTLPFLLLLLDWWPLGRLTRRAILEKIPLFAISGLGIWMALAGQKAMSAMSTTEIVPLSLRLGNAAVACATYLRKFSWPTDLAVIYPLRVVTAGETALSVLVLLAITAVAFAVRRTMPYVLMGWLWFLGTLVPVIGLVQIGAQSMADRYTYVPYIGLSIAVVWAVRDLAAIDPRARFAAAVAVIVILAAQAWQQTQRWKNTVTLFEHTIAVTGPNPIAEYTLGQTLQTSDPDRAIPHFRRIIEIADQIRRGVPPALYAQSHIGLGNALLNKARTTSDVALIDEASAAYRRAIQIDPQGTAAARRNLALADSMRQHVASRKSDPAIGDKEVDQLLDRGVAAMNAQNMDEAIAVFRQAVARQPNSVATRMYLGLAYMRVARNAEAAAELEKAHELDAIRANDYITRALKMPPNPRNLADVIAGLR